MNIPFIPEDLLEINENYKVVFNNDLMLIVDDWYKNFDQFYDLLRQAPLPRWKWQEGGKNFVDYYDCRPLFNLNFPDHKKINRFVATLKELIAEKFNDTNNLELENNLLEFNFYKNIKKNVSSDLQHFPHVDFKYNCIVYFDKICSGGTAIYPDLKNLQNTESYNLLHNISNYKRILIQSKPNRLVIFKGNFYHGGFIQNHNDYVDDWRMNQILFFTSN